MLRHLSIRALSNSRDICKLSQAFTHLFTVDNRGCHRKGIFYEDENSDERSDSRQFSDDGPRRRTPYKQRSFDDSNKRNYRNKHSFSQSDEGEYSFKQHPGRRNFSNHDSPFERNRGNSKNFEQEAFFQNLKKPSFDNLSPIEKDFYAEHPTASERSKDEVDAIRRQWNMSIRGSNVPNPIAQFEELCLPDDLKKVVLKQGYPEPTPIQAQGWPIAMSGRDMVGISQTGSGKTLVFALPGIIHATNQTGVKSNRLECRPQVLVLAPTRELVQQILHVTNTFCTSCGLHSATAYGGASKMVQLNKLKGADICVATPGRLIDFVSEGSVNLQHCTYLVLDEADRMLDMGFEPQIRKIVDQIRPDRQTLMWSATWPKEIQELAEDFLTDYIQVTVGHGELVANPNITQKIYCMEEDDKEERLAELLHELIVESGNKVLVFAQTKKKVDYLGRNLNRGGIPALCIHGNVSQTRRDEVLNYFRTEKSCVLIATDVAARGLDISDVQHVVNVDFPTNIEDYIHRIGRTARGVGSGMAHSFFTSENAGIVRDLVSVLKQSKQEINEELHGMVEPMRAKSRGKFNYLQKGRFQRRQFAY